MGWIDESPVSHKSGLLASLRGKARPSLQWTLAGKRVHLHDLQALAQCNYSFDKL